MFAMVNTYPRLESENLVRNYFNPIMHALAPTYDDVMLISDVRDMGLICPPHIGIGRHLSKHWSMFLQAGYSAGKVRTKADDTSVFLLPLHTDFEIKRGALYWGLGLDYLPWGTAHLADYRSWRERLRAAKPFLGTRLTWTHASYDAKIKVGLKPIKSIGVKFSNDWLIPSINLNLGIDIPINSNNVLTMNGGYSFFRERQYDFEGPAFTLAWKHFFR